MDHLRYSKGETVFRQGDQPDGIYVLDGGICSVEVDEMGTTSTVLTFSDQGTMFGELSLFTEDVRPATVRAECQVHVLRMDKKIALSVLEEYWGGKDELHHRADLLGAADLFAGLRNEELLLLAAHMVRRSFSRPGVQITTEGKKGNALYLLESGSPMVTIKGIGRVRELNEGDVFGELAVLQSPHHWRTATVTTVDPYTVLWSLSQEEVHRLIPLDRRLATLEKCQQAYGERAKIRASARIDIEIGRFWDMLTTYSRSIHESKQDRQKSNPDFWRALKRTVGRGEIQKEAYTQLHLRISKVLAPGPTFIMKQALKTAHRDWCEDITAFAGDSSSSVYIEMVKAQIVKQAEKLVSQTGWSTLFAQFDSDGSGTLCFAEFKKAVREDLKIPTRDMVLLYDLEQRKAAEKLATVTAVSSVAGTAIFSLLELARSATHKRGERSRLDPMLMRDTIENKQLKRLFKTADVDRGGDVSATEFAAFMAKPTTKDPDKKVLEVAAKKQVKKLGWDTLFLKYDLDGSGELEFEEFEAVIRGDCELDADQVSDETLSIVFDAIDVDGGGTIDTKELTAFLCHNPFDRDMDYDDFSESLFQLASGWVENEDLQDHWVGCSKDTEDRYIRFLRFLWYRIVDGEDMMSIEQVQIASKGAGGLQFAQLSELEIAANKRAQRRKPMLKTVAKQVMNVNSLSQVHKYDWESRLAAVEERRAGVLRARAEAAHANDLRVEQVQQRVAAAERDAAKIQTSPVVYVPELQLSDNLFDTVVAAVSNSGRFTNIHHLAGTDKSQSDATIGGGTVVGGICHGQGNGSRTSAVFSRVYVQPVAYVDPEAGAKARIRLQARRKAEGNAKRMAKKAAAKVRQSLMERQAGYVVASGQGEEPDSAQAELEPISPLGSTGLDTGRQEAYDSYNRMLDESAFWKGPEWLPAQQMAAAGIATPYRHSGPSSSWRQVPMRPGAGGAGNRWVADLAGMHSGSDRACRMELAIDASPRGTPRSFVSPSRFPSRSRLVKPQQLPNSNDAAAGEPTILPAVPSTEVGNLDVHEYDDRATTLLYEKQTRPKVLPQSDRKGKPVGPAGFRSPRAVPDASQSDGVQHVPSPPRTPRAGNASQAYTPRHSARTSKALHASSGIGIATGKQVQANGDEAAAPAFMYGKRY